MRCRFRGLCTWSRRRRAGQGPCVPSRVRLVRRQGLLCQTPVRCRRRHSHSGVCRSAGRGQRRGSVAAGGCASERARRRLRRGGRRESCGRCPAAVSVLRQLDHARRAMQCHPQWDMASCVLEVCGPAACESGLRRGVLLGPGSRARDPGHTLRLHRSQGRYQHPVHVGLDGSHVSRCCHGLPSDSPRRTREDADSRCVPHLEWPAGGAGARFGASLLEHEAGPPALAERGRENARARGRPALLPRRPGVAQQAGAAAPLRWCASLRPRPAANGAALRGVGVWRFWPAPSRALHGQGHHRRASRHARLIGGSCRCLRLRGRCR
mmetsp:Transcript_30229/g.86632  ORF Transcript_30229/g.86632 Transcript_30229/m.86632 type:complete len:323 (-) Transcript_30229:1143-2111(-)